MIFPPYRRAGALVCVVLALQGLPGGRRRRRVAERQWAVTGAVDRRARQRASEPSAGRLFPGTDGTTTRASSRSVRLRWDGIRRDAGQPGKRPFIVREVEARDVPGEGLKSRHAR